MAIVGAALVNFLITVVAKRESGSLKRRRATPVPSWVLIAADAASPNCAQPPSHWILTSSRPGRDRRARHRGQNG